MKFHLLLAALGASSAWACNPMAYVHALPIKAVVSPYFVPHTQNTLTVRFKGVAGTGSGGKNVGFMLKGAEGKQVASGVCKLSDDPTDVSVACSIPALDVAKYALFLSGDASCGDKSYFSADTDVEVIEPAVVSSIAPSHGPKASPASIEIKGSNIGGDHVTCEFTFFAGKGAKTDGSGNPLGCSMASSSDASPQRTKSFTSTSVKCKVPQWPGPLQKCGVPGVPGGCVPLPGAVCDTKVLVQVTNDAKVSSVSQTFYVYDTADTVVV